MWARVAFGWSPLPPAATSCDEPLPIFDDAEVKIREVSGNEGLEHTDDPASIKFTVGVCHLQIKADTHKHTHQLLSQQYPNFRQTDKTPSASPLPSCCIRGAGAACTDRCSTCLWGPQPGCAGQSPAGCRAGTSACFSTGRENRQRVSVVSVEWDASHSRRRLTAPVPC